MAITMQGNWTLRIKTRSTACAQRFTVSGADIGNGTHEAAPGSTLIVTGESWALAVEHRPEGRAWRPSRTRIGLPVMAGGSLRVELSAQHGSEDDDDSLGALVLTCSVAADASDHVIYGSTKTYSGAAFLNPCRHDYIVIDAPAHLRSLCARYPDLGAVVQRLYPERLRASGADDLMPVVLPTGLPNVSNGLVFAPGAPDASGVPQLTARRAPFKSAAMKAGVELLSAGELQAIAQLRDAGIRLRCDMAPAPALRLGFQQYHRTPEERRGAPYRGRGERHALGEAMTDDHGNYMFRFSPAWMHGSAGETPTEQRPDLVLQVLGAGTAPLFESAPYNNVSNLVRIDLCVPAALLQVRRPTAGGVLLQRGANALRRCFGGVPEPLPYGGRHTHPGFIRRAAV